MSDSLNFRVCGRQGAPTLALLHGFMSCNAQWLANEAALGEHYQLVMIELWGHGDSPSPEDPAAYTTARYIEEFERIRKTLGVASWLLFGQSYGAGLMLNYAAAQPECCPAVITTNSRSAYGTVIARNAEKAQSRRRENPLDDPDFQLRQLPYHPINARRFPDEIKQAMVAKADRMHPHVVKLGGLLGRDLSYRDRLDEVPVPVMIANGVYERSFQEDVAHLQTHFRGQHLVGMSGGHSVNIEAADEFNIAVLDFMSRVATFESPVRI